MREAPLEQGPADDDTDEWDDSGSGGGYGWLDNPEIAAVVQEVIEGLMARDAEALDLKVYPNLSENFAHAGLDRDGFFAYLKSELRTSPERIISDFGVYGYIFRDGDEASVDVRIHYSGYYPPNDETDFNLNFQGVQEKSFEVVQVEDSWELWVVQDIVTVSGEETLFGGEEFDIVISDDFYPEDEDFPSQGEVNIDGMLHLPELKEGQRLTANFSLDMGDQRGHAQMWGRPESYLYDWDMTDMQGWFVNVDLTLPVDEQPENYMIPGELPLGVDAVDLTVRFIVTDENGGPVGVKGFTYAYPNDYDHNKAYCGDLLGAEVDGLWLLRVDDPRYSPFELLDVRRAGGQLYGASLFPAFRHEGWVGGWEPAGSFLGKEISLAANTAQGEIVYRALWQGDRLTGIIDYPDAEIGANPTFIGRKLSNRCVGLPHFFLNDASLKIAIGDKQFACRAARAGENIGLNCGGSAFAGRMVRNALVVDEAGNSGLALFLAFEDDTRGYAALLDKATGLLSEGAFSVQ
ncbi:MAG TPA: hypothetical protein PK961_10985 [bacterium]|nr:hypothetical protein [bacterium]